MLASELGVYGTILGAAVVSIGATTGGAVFQHIFKRTGEQLREAVDRTGPGPAVNGLRQVPADSPSAPVTRPRLSEEWNEPRTVRARRRWSWKTYAAVSSLVFVLAMVPILAFELATGQPVSATVKGESGNGTSLGGTVGTKPSSPPADAPSHGPSSPPSTGGRAPEASPSAGGGASAPTPSKPGPDQGSSPGAGTDGGGKASPSAGPSATPSAQPTPSGGTGAKPSGAASPQPPVPSGAAAGVSPPPAAPTGEPAP
ncbi:hypothetical protein [Kitasatospora sp. NPDC088351]|uniref:hypothetical protein n=1 Tax=Kitasatospora sp. NPDC088351 TaxID=3155180 RepID=UPI003435CC0F